MYKFKSKATGDLIMLDPNGRQVLRIIGKDDPATVQKGILLPEQMMAAIEALEAAVAQDEAAQSERAKAAKAKGEEPPRAEGISLRQRATPFIAMLKRAQQANVEVVWGV
jgi:cyclopropane-fatty-acyl-phospholipid synthase